jgi:hypothetical protein
MFGVGARKYPLSLVAELGVYGCLEPRAHGHGRFSSVQISLNHVNKARGLAGNQLISACISMLWLSACISLAHAHLTEAGLIDT